MATVFFDMEGVMHVEFLPKGTTINSAAYWQTLNRLHKAIKGKRRGKLSAGVILLHDNATPHTARQISELMQRFKWEVWQHPPYSPHLAPCDYHLFGKLKTDLGGRRFQNDEEVKAAVSGGYIALEVISKHPESKRNPRNVYSFLGTMWKSEHTLYVVIAVLLMCRWFDKCP